MEIDKKKTKFKLKKCIYFQNNYSTVLKEIEFSRIIFYGYQTMILETILFSVVFLIFFLFFISNEFIVNEATHAFWHQISNAQCCVQFFFSKFKCLTSLKRIVTFHRHFRFSSQSSVLNINFKVKKIMNGEKN